MSIERRSIIAFVVILVLVTVSFAMAFASTEKPYEGTKLVILSASDGVEGSKTISPHIPQFEKETGIKVEFVELSQTNLHTRLATIFATGSAATDLVWTWIAWTAEFANAGYIEDITDWLTPEEWDAFLPAALNCITYKGRRYGIPKFYSVRSFFYNKKMFREAGLDPNKPPLIWDDFVDCAKKTTNKEAEKWGVLHDYGSNTSLLILFQEHLVLTGGRITDDEDNIIFNSDEGVLALEKIVELNKLGVVDPASFGIGEGPVKRSRWIQGNDAMEWGWAADYNLSNTSKQSKIAGEVGAALIPSIVTSGALTGSEGYAISKFSKNKEAAFEFLKFMSRPEIQKDMTIRTGWYPVVQSVFYDNEAREKNPLINVVIEQVKFPTYRFGAPYATELTDVLAPELLLAIKGEKPPKQALDDAAKAAEAILKYYK